jgi:hypothetical protein
MFGDVFLFLNESFVNFDGAAALIPTRAAFSAIVSAEAPSGAIWYVEPGTLFVDKDIRADLRKCKKCVLSGGLNAQTTYVTFKCYDEGGNYFVCFVWAQQGIYK